jgi:hypothetical protein
MHVPRVIDQDPSLVRPHADGPQPPSAPVPWPELVVGLLDQVLEELVALRAATAGFEGTGSLADFGSITGPNPGALVARVEAPGRGSYKIGVRTFKDGDATIANLRLRLGGGVFVELFTLSNVVSHTDVPEVLLRAGQEVSVEVIAASAQTYAAHLVLTRVA